CWPVTKDNGPRDVAKHLLDQDDFSYEIEAIAPFLVRRTTESYVIHQTGALSGVRSGEYYFWFFGFLQKVSGPTSPVEIDLSEFWDDPADPLPASK
ncbi:MAG: hypothetical protein AAGH89_11680, partial [Verrucomicrobiota bacterium]